ncbi:serine/threonine-protein kinase [Cellulomonas wangsupingiae]|uniref:serine/threonine-protein kinase n=1 Tax=Cellulomonas wangsupingiae TaxID=2968085 RepID=UPI001D0E6EB2|nr:serine/threonine-protein kinase [Cellulomonas wangsupingiae]MCM0641161.1 serine/threonine protein kinase [Cellulomonas wangsupingiae]
MTVMHLDGHVWTLGGQLPDGEGAFGLVHDVTDESGRAGVAKLVAKDPGAERELLVGDSLRASAIKNVVPVWDTGEYGDQWVIVMPKADKSLLAHMQAAPVPPAEAVAILTDIAVALSELAAADPAIVHRDLKPGNVLLLGDTWCLADFGIARYAEQTTAIDTRKYNLTRPYAAPEQWQMDRATPATDVYAFGVLAYELLAGARPFLGPDFRQQHLFEKAPTLSAGTPRLRTLIEECLYKPRAARPTAANIAARLAIAASEPVSPGSSKLATANAVESARLARSYAEVVRLADEEQNAAALFAVAEQSFDAIWSPLLTTIEADAPLAVIERDVRGQMVFVAQLRGGKIGVGKPIRAGSWQGPFKVIAYASIAVNQRPSRNGYEGRAHSLWFCDAQDEGRFAWFETAFMQGGFSGGFPGVNPFSQEPHSGGIAFSNVIGTMQLARPLVEVDRTNPTEFVDRWIGWFADAAGGSLTQPHTMPEQSAAGSYRT